MKRQETDEGVRRTYSLIFPVGISPQQVSAWLHALSGLPRLASWNYRTNALVLELWATDRGLTYRLRAREGAAVYAVAQLRTLLPGIRVTPVDTEACHRWARVVELGARRYTRSFRIPDPSILAANLLAVTQGLRRDETLLLQVVLLSAVPERPPVWARTPRPVRFTTAFWGQPPMAERDAVTDQRNKLAEVNLLAVLRVAVQTTSETRTQQLLAGVKGVLASVRTADNGFHARLVPQRWLVRRVNGGWAPLLFPVQLAATELVGLLAWPLHDPHVAGLPQARARHLPPTEAISRRGLVVANLRYSALMSG